jgi:predicted amidophosphoribosyltransferase
VLKKLLDLLIPSRCAACGARGEPCCARCAGAWGSAAEVIRAPTTGLVRVFALARYRGVARRLLIAYKERGRRDLAEPLGRALAEALVVLPLRRSVGPGRPGGLDPAHPLLRRASAAPAIRPARAICLVPAPSRPSAARVRGGPHVERLANEAASILAARGIEVAVAPALELAGDARDAVGLGREQRVANLAGRLRFREAGRPPPGYPIVVLDDVVTTGATAAACAKALAAEGFTVSAVLTLLAAG